jgi:hypothetical protein
MVLGKLHEKGLWNNTDEGERYMGHMSSGKCYRDLKKNRRKKEQN